MFLGFEMNKVVLLLSLTLKNIKNTDRYFIGISVYCQIQHSFESTKILLIQYYFETIKILQYITNQYRFACY